MGDSVETLIEIKCKQLDINGEKNTITLSVTGRRFLRVNGVYLSYEDDSLIDGITIATVIKINRREVVLKRMGAIKTLQHFARGLEYNSIYETPYGNFRLTTETKRFWVRIKDDYYSSGTAELVFNIAIDGIKQSENMLTVKWWS